MDLCVVSFVLIEVHFQIPASCRPWNFRFQEEVQDHRCIFRCFHWADRGDGLKLLPVKLGGILATVVWEDGLCRGIVQEWKLAHGATCRLSWQCPQPLHLKKGVRAQHQKLFPNLRQYQLRKVWRKPFNCCLVVQCDVPYQTPLRMVWWRECLALPAGRILTRNECTEEYFLEGDK